MYQGSTSLSLSDSLSLALSLPLCVTPFLCHSQNAAFDPHLYHSPLSSHMPLSAIIRGFNSSERMSGELVQSGHLGTNVYHIWIGKLGTNLGNKYWHNWGILLPTFATSLGTMGESWYQDWRQ